jgi:hypothetical protein
MAAYSVCACGNRCQTYGKVAEQCDTVELLRMLAPYIIGTCFPTTILLRQSLFKNCLVVLRSQDATDATSGARYPSPSNARFHYTVSSEDSRAICVHSVHS